ncbi:hypothetical protein F9U64_22545 [Gracilibacillus oryzae]|uniref:Uncharacterized protein n=1 Tax=Gracilibacillus oryzae TaxID=1672701 RepID=A0A7C8GPS1_9BACI|nr:hypothetical protein [Gracilibacillus oryzae]KAB8125500.1 hypothetical protein F9U64_22545 [Gracilibacillus oryzae]
MHYTYGNSSKWRNKGILSIITGALVILVWIITFIDNELSYVVFLILTAIFLVFVCFRVYRAIYYFKLPEKDYVIIDDNSLILKEMFLPNYKIPYAEIKHVAKINKILVITLENNREKHIYLDWLDKEDSSHLIEQLQGKVGILNHTS